MCFNRSTVFLGFGSLKVVASFVFFSPLDIFVLFVCFGASLILCVCVCGLCFLSLQLDGEIPEDRDPGLC